MITHGLVSANHSMKPVEAVMWVFATGFVVSLGLIVAIGAQNAWVLSNAMRGYHRGVIASVCILCDSILIIIGVYAIQHIQSLIPPLVPILTVLGVALLLSLAFKALMRAVKGGEGLQVSDVINQPSAVKVAITALAITLLNPHVYLDTLVLIGSVGAQQTDKLWFVVGACFASFVWFSLLTGCAPLLKRHLSSPTHWRVFDAGMGVILLAVAVSLAVTYSQ